MIRFYTLGIWEVVRSEGYEYVMRMDEDSFIWSPIRYNLFAFMERQGLEYGYRLKEFPDEEPKLANKDAKEQSENPIMNWIGSLSNPVNTDNY